MECKSVQDRLLTDYLDGELRGAERIALDAHLKGCVECREFLETARKVAVAPFREAEILRPDGAVWQRIQERITAEETRFKSWRGMLKEICQPLFRIPRPVFQAALVTALVLGIAVFVRGPLGRMDPAYTYLAEQMTFMKALGSGDAESLNGDLNDYETLFDEMAG